MSTRRWMMKRILQDKPDESDTSKGGGSQTGDGGEEEKETKGTNSGDLNTGTESPFKGTALEGMSVEEVNSRFRLQQETIQSQGRTLNRFEEERRHPKPSETREAPKPEKFTAEQFFADPEAVLNARDERLVSTLTDHLDKIISPFREDFAKNRVNSAWEEVHQRYSDLYEYKGYIDAALQEQRISDPTAATIRLLYLSVKDQLGIVGIPEKKEETQRDGGEGNRRPSPPQHRSSSQPLNVDPGEKKLRRELDENEKRLAREMHMSEEEFLDWQDTPPESVVGSKLGRKE